MSRRKTPLIGFDPLAWMRDDPARWEAADGDPSRAQASAAPAVSGPPSESLPATEKADGSPPPDAPNAGPADDDAFRLSPSLTIGTVRAVHEALAGLSGRSRVVLEAQAVEEIDTAGLQLLAAFVADAARRGVAIEWRGVTPVLRQGADRLDLARLMGLPPCRSR